MILHKKYAICLVILCTMRCVTQCSGPDIRTNNVSEGSEEDKTLKEALVLVDLLKNASHSAPPANATHSTISQRTPVTDELRPRRRMAEVTPQPFQDNPGQNGGIQPTYKIIRRRIPDDYYYDYPSRSLRRRVPFPREHGGGPTTVVRKTSGINGGMSSDVPKTVAITTKSAANAHRTTPTDNPVATSTGTIKATSAVSTRGCRGCRALGGPRRAADEGANGAKALHRYKMAHPAIAVINSESENTVQNNDEDPVQSLVASELELEMKTEKIKTMRNNPRSTQRTTKMEINSVMKLPKPTLKVHLGGSTRYPIPLPQNHAFCYTNPRNALCRTSI